MNGKKLSKKWLYTFIGIAFVALATCTAANFRACRKPRTRRQRSCNGAR